MKSISVIKYDIRTQILHLNFARMENTEKSCIDENVLKNDYCKDVIMIYQKVAFILKLSVQKKKENDVILWNSCNSTICLVHMKVGDVGLVVSFKFIGIPEAYLETCQTSVMKFFQKQSTAKSCYLLSPKSFVIDV